MKSLLMYVFCLLLSLVQAVPVGAATPQPVSRDYIASYFTAVAAGSCLGVYLPQKSAEFSFLRSYGWDIQPQVDAADKVEAHFAIASNYFPELQSQLYLVTFRGSASKKDWHINLKTSQVNYGGTSLAEMEKLAAAPLKEKSPAVHEGFNSYVDTVLRQSVLDAEGRLQGVFKAVAENNNAHLILTGHSLGGAAATLLGERLLDLGLPREKFTVVTFGAPAIGNTEFAAAYGDRMQLIRVTNMADPIPGSLQTFFGGYKQFGEQYKYKLSPKRSGVQHDMGMYFDYSVSEYFKAYDKQVELGRLRAVPAKKITEGKPVVALWIKTAENLQRVAYAIDLQRFVTEEYQKMLPSYIVMGRGLADDAYKDTDVIRQSRAAGADYVLICGIDGDRPRNEKYWYLTLEQSLFDQNGRMLSMSSLGNKIAPAVGNIQAAGENLLAAREELHKQLPFVVTQYKPSLRW